MSADADGGPRLRFYLAADSAEAYDGLQKRFPQRIVFTPRPCADERCDFRDCRGMLFSLVDMMNLARTRIILGSGWSSYSEVRPPPCEIAPCPCVLGAHTRDVRRPRSTCDAHADAAQRDAHA